MVGWLILDCHFIVRSGGNEFEIVGFFLLGGMHVYGYEIFGLL